MQKKLYYGIFRTLRALALITVLAGILSACKSYHLGSPAEIPFKSIYVAPVLNHSYAPQAQAIISAMLRENFTRDTRIKLVAEKENADAVLLVDLTKYERSDSARNRQDTGVADSFDVQIKADVSLLDQETGTYLFTNRSIQATTNAYTSNPYQDDTIVAYQLSERQAMEQLARELARKITDMVLSPW
ncbi:MAG: hypothetical protein ACJAT5_000388 [Lentimonas sp.]|jgi:hypothetical protein